MHARTGQPHVRVGQIQLEHSHPIKEARNVSDSCLFCRIVAGEIPAEIVHQDDEVIAFRDIAPKAPLHLLVIPRRHIASLNEAEEADAPVLGRLMTTAARLAKSEGVADDGWRAVVNVGEGGGQTVFHVHLHVMAGRKMTWPPG